MTNALTQPMVMPSNALRSPRGRQVNALTAEKPDIFDRQLQDAQYSPMMLKGDDERRFQEKLTSSPWYKDFVSKYQEIPRMPENGGDYDYRRAISEGLLDLSTPGAHGMSRTNSGAWLKNPTGHPTAWMELFMEKTGKDPDAIGMNRQQAAEYLESIDAR
jgi:hypothetical protein